MRGINRFPSTTATILEDRSGRRDGPCVFISHSRLDKPQARQIAKFVQDLEIDIYFDEHDPALQLADELKDGVKVVECIKDGIHHSTHLLGIVTENTKDSWWVPYEIGYATGNNKACAHLIQREVDALPAYILAAEVLTDLESLRDYIPRNPKQTGFDRYCLETMKALLLETTSIPRFVPEQRSLDELRFY